MSLDEKIRAYTQLRLSEDDCAAFEKQMAKDPALRAEVAAITAMNNVFSHEDDASPKNGWARLSKRIDAETQGAANDNRPIRISLLQAACIAAIAVIGWQVVGVPLLTKQQATYVTVSAESSEASVQVVFNATASLSEVTETLDDLQGQIVDGPSALGVYIVEFSDVDARDTAFLALSKREDIALEVLKN